MIGEIFVDQQRLIDIAINWFPMLLLIGVWIFIMARMRGGPYTKYQKDCMELTRRQTEALERIAVMLEKKAGP
jgi:ATP-dependent Zn protease